MTSKAYIVCVCASVTHIFDISSETTGLILDQLHSKSYGGAGYFWLLLLWNVGHGIHAITQKWKPETLDNTIQDFI